MGFSDIKIVFGDSPYNGRKNYWMVSAVNGFVVPAKAGGQEMGE